MTSGRGRRSARAFASSPVSSTPGSLPIVRSNPRCDTAPHSTTARACLPSGFSLRGQARLINRYNSRISTLRGKNCVSSLPCLLLSHRVISPCNWLAFPLHLPSRPWPCQIMKLLRYDSGAAQQGRPGTDRLISIRDIRTLFKLGRTAAYELTHRPGFPAPVQVSRRCLRWWASEVDAYADALQREGARRRTRRTTTRQVDESAATPRRITGTVRAARGRREPCMTHTRDAWLGP